MARVRLSVDIDTDLKRRIKLAAVNSDQSVREWIEAALTEVLDRRENHDWLESDLSRLGEIEPYEFQEGEMEQGYPVYFEPGVGLVIDMPEDEVEDNSNE